MEINCKTRNCVKPLHLKNRQQIECSGPHKLGSQSHDTDTAASTQSLGQSALIFSFSDLFGQL